MASMVEITCKCGCARKKLVRKVDVARGWGKFFSKSCKAKEQERRTGQYKAFCERVGDDEYEDDADFEGAGWDAHKDSF